MSWELGKPSSNEDEWFARRDAEWIKERRAEMDRADAEAAKAAKALKCPHCGTPLSEEEFKGVKLDYCGSCKGIWLEPGELELVILLKRADQMHLVHTITG